MLSLWWRMTHPSEACQVLSGSSSSRAAQGRGAWPASARLKGSFPDSLGSGLTGGWGGGLRQASQCPTVRSLKSLYKEHSLVVFMVFFAF